MKINKVTIPEHTNIYEGEVTISLLKGRKEYKKFVIHNTASTEFFTILCNAVIGNNFASKMPKMVGLYDAAGDEIAHTRTAYSTCSVGSEVVNSITIPYAQFEFIIPSSFLINGRELKKIKLFNSASAAATALAEVEINNVVTLDSSSNLMIVWKLSFHNTGD